MPVESARLRKRPDRLGSGHVVYAITTTVMCQYSVIDIVLLAPNDCGCREQSVEKIALGRGPAALAHLPPRFSTFVNGQPLSLPRGPSSSMPIRVKQCLDGGHRRVRLSSPWRQHVNQILRLIHGICLRPAEARGVIPSDAASSQLPVHTVRIPA
jgi:hypothetical protein